MIYFLLAHTFAFLLDVIAIAWRSDHEKDLEILLLRQQLHILQRKHPRPPRISRWEKLALAVLATKLTAVGGSARSRLGQNRARVQAGDPPEVAPRAGPPQMDIYQPTNGRSTAHHRRA